MNELVISVLDFLRMFHGRLSPKQLSVFLDIEESLGNSTVGCKLFPEIMGIPKDLLESAGLQGLANFLKNVL